jgi:proteic killer suppression protein
MVRSFGNRMTEDIFFNRASASAARIPKVLWERARRKLHYMNAATGLGDLQSPPGYRLERLGGRFSGYWSIRSNDQWRITFRVEA